LRRYVEQEENLSTIRGRFLLDQQIRQNLVRGNRLFCRFTISDVDNVENRIVLWALVLLHRSSHWPEQLRQKLQTQIMHFGGVSVLPFRPRHVPELVYDRLSTRYSAIHRWCRFFIDQMTILSSTGEVEFHGFRLNMFKLFERFVFCVFQEAARRRTRIHVDKRKFPLDKNRRLNILPDILITGPSFVAVGDAKYKITRDDVGRHPDLYQVMAYSTSLGLLEATHRPQGFLIYPASERSLELEGDLQVLTSTRGDSNLTIRTIWFDLAGENVFSNAVTSAESALRDASYVARALEPLTTQGLVGYPPVVTPR
jgi:5-methylcytosine-specific restriction enzyme subunit McrC